MGRPATKPARLKDGFYIEVRQKGSQFKARMRSETRQGMIQLAEHYRRMQKDVIILGEHKKDKWLESPREN